MVRRRARCGRSATRGRRGARALQRVGDGDLRDAAPAGSWRPTVPVPARASGRRPTRRRYRPGYATVHPPRPARRSPGSMVNRSGGAAVRRRRGARRRQGERPAPLAFVVGARTVAVIAERVARSPGEASPGGRRSSPSRIPAAHRQRSVTRTPPAAAPDPEPSPPPARVARSSVGSAGSSGPSRCRGRRVGPPDDRRARSAPRPQPPARGTAARRASCRWRRSRNGTPGPRRGRGPPRSRTPPPAGRRRAGPTARSPACG